MARTNPHHDWDEPRRGADAHSGAEWESLRNELVALLDQVEDQLATPRAKPAPQPSAPAPRPAHMSRHGEALRSVRQAVDRLADRSETDTAPRRDSVADAISQIRARQTGTAFQYVPAAPQPAPEPARTPAVELAGFAQAVAGLGQRIEQFESRISSRIDALDQHGDISAQVAQLSEVIELLASAVGESGQVKRLEAQIVALAETVTSGSRREQEATAARIEELTVTIEKLVAHQIEATGREQQHGAEAEARQLQGMRLIEESVRNIYDRIDALETSRASASPDIDRLSDDMAALAAAVRDTTDPQALLARIDALGERIGRMERPERDEATVLRESVDVLRGVVAEAIEPRFSALEARIEDIGAQASISAATPTAPSDLEAQLRQIARRVEETSSQLQSLSRLYEADTGKAEAPDLAALADLIVERTRTDGVSETVALDGVGKSDLDALEARLAKLFASEGAPKGQPTEQLSGVKDSIAQVDSRLARLEAMLNSQTKPAPQAEAEPVVAAAVLAQAAAPARPRRSKPADTMPADPVSGTTRDEPVAEAEPAIEHIDIVEPTPAPAFRIDPDSIERPAKPQSSFSMAEESPFQNSRKDGAGDAPANGPTVSRSSFIEAARRSARQQVLAEDTEEPKSLIGRAMARFQRGEREAPEAAAAEAPQGKLRLPGREPVLPPRDKAPKAKAADAIDPFVEAPADGHEEDEKQPGFLARNKRALLLGTALVVAIAMAVPLVLNRMPPAPSAPVTPPAVTEPAPTVEAEPEAPAEVSELMSGVRMIDTSPALSAASLDRAVMLDTATIDPIETAALPGQPDRYIDRSASLALEQTSTVLPQISVPEGIEPAILRTAAEGGDRRAQFEVGAILTEGHIVPQDFAGAAAWYERSAAQGFAPAQYRLGNLYEGGRGVDKDLELARLWYQRAAEAGNRMSMHNLASLYAGGELETQDFAAAAHWFEEAAARGLTDSQFNLGMLHARGLGVEQDFEKSYIWFSLAAKAGDTDALGARDDVARSLDTETVQRLNETIAGWIPAEIDLAANFAPIGTWDQAFDPGQAITNRDVILRVQVLLGKLGFDIGQPDGIAGPRTREAILAFERATGMSESGAINPRLLAVLGSQPV